MTTRTKITFTGTLLVALLGQQAHATDEIVVHGKAMPVAAVAAEQRLDMERYIRTFNEQLRTTVQQDVKRELAPKLEIASRVAPTRG